MNNRIKKSAKSIEQKARTAGRLLRKGTDQIVSVADFFQKSEKKPGASPGTMVFVGKRKTEKTIMASVDYNESACVEKTLERVEECFDYTDASTRTWINVTGVHDTETVEKIGKHFGLHPLVMEDIVHTGQRAKMEDYDDYVFIVAKILYRDEKNGRMLSEQISIVMGKNHVLTFQETETGMFEPLLERIRQANGQIRKRGSDYLVYALLDAIVDHYFLLIEDIGTKLEVLEELIENESHAEIPREIRDLKRETMLLRRAAWPLKSMLGSLQIGEVSLIQRETGVFYGDIHDHAVQIGEMIETFRDMLSEMMSLHLSNVNARMNEVMKVLTVMASIFIPLTFIAGVYGMNFKYMPELQLRWGYFSSLGFMAAAAGGMVWHFKRRQWL